jgi:chromosome segregation protein
MADQAAQASAAAASALEAAQARLDQCRREHDTLAAHRVEPAALALADRQAAQASEAAALARAQFIDAEQALLGANASAAALQAEAQQAAAAHRSATERLAEAEHRAATASRAAAGLDAEMRAAEAARVPPVEVAQAAAHAEAACAAADAAAQAVIRAERAAREAEAARLAAGRAAAEATTAMERARSRVEEAERTASHLAAELEEHGARMAAAEQGRPDGASLQEAEAAALRAEARHAACRLALEECVRARAQAESHLDQARADAAAASAESLRISAEIEGLRAALSDSGAQAFPRIIDDIDVPAGLEAAVAAALGDAASASLDRQAPRHWAALPSLPEALLPGTPLAHCITCPAVLTRLLSQTALIGDDADGAAVQRGLLPGQAAVNRAGDLWRWDGLVTSGAAQTPEAARLEMRRRLRARMGEAAASGAAAEVAQQRAGIAEAAAQAARGAESEARSEEAEAALAARAAAATRDALAVEAADAQAQVEALLAPFARLQESRRAAAAALQHHVSALQAAADPAIAQAALAAAEDRFDQDSRALDAARDASDRARAAALGAQDEARRIAAQAAAAEQRAALVAPQLSRAQSESQAADAALQQAQRALAGLADPADLLDSADVAARAAAEALDRLQQARSDRDAAEQAMADTREQAALLTSRHQRVESALAAQATLLEQASRQHASAASERDAVIAHAAGLPDLAELTTAAAQARRRLAEARQDSLRTTADWQSLGAEVAQAEARRIGLAEECAGWQARLADGRRRADQLAQRHDAARRQCALLAAAPEEIARRAAASGAALAEAEQAHAAAAGRLAAAEDQLRAAAAALRHADASEAASRAALARAEGTRDAAEGAFAAVQARIAERLGQDRAHLPAAPADLSDAAEERARRRADRLTREREDMGPVNLRADAELADIEDKANALERERDELTTAVAKLRGAIGHLNREGRSRLSAVFTQVDQHFRTLFTRMMGGGRAHLALTGSDDPLLAGLEIYAEPPGKKLSTLSLLSGGEQALTALSLIFAVFRCTPAPISVLDEVDAPLDDANVERFCTLLDEIVRDTGTRFLVVTHHQVTMSRMDRLFGVTMQERGVSRLLSVDLQRATAMVAEEALQAAE